MTMTRWVKCAAILVMGLGACRPSGGGGDTNVSDATDSSMVNDTGGTDVVQPGDVQTDNPQPTDGGGDGGARSVTIRQVQDIADPMHPAPGSRVRLEQSGMVALTPRVLIGSSRGDSSGRCRWAVWVGDGTGGDFSGVQVQELVNRGDAGTCFDAPAGRIPRDVLPGDTISLVDNASYSEFCLGGSGVTMCRNWEQTQLFVGAAGAAFTRTGMGAAPSPTMVNVADIGQTMDRMARGPRTLALEGVLVRVQNVRVTVVTETNDAGTFSDYFLSDAADPSRRVGVMVSNFPRTGCVRDYLAARNGMMVTSVTGVLLPDFGDWMIRIRDENDIGGLTCASPDAGGMDAARD